MKRAVLITQAAIPFNRIISSHLLSQGCSVAAVFDDRPASDEYAASLSAENGERFFPLYGIPEEAGQIRQAVDQAAQRMGGLDTLIHGAQERDEEAEYGADAVAFGLKTLAALRCRFLYSCSAASHMARKKAGHIVFLMHSDALYYVNGPASPVMNYGMIAMMKTLAKELSPFRIAVNALTFGCHTNPEEEAGEKEWRKKLEIHALKPYIPQRHEMAELSLDWLLRAPEHLISGQNLHIGAGMETVV